MKADRYGTLAEQKRAEQGWHSAADRPKCGHCRHLQREHEKARLYCTLGGFATAEGAACRQFEAQSQ